MDSPLLLDVKDLEEVHKEVTGVELKKIIIPKVKQQEVQLLGSEAEFTAAVGMSRLWDARAAGREVAENTLKKLNGKKPDFFLLFTTIHYEKHGGFQELLNGAWEILPEGTPLIGGTIAGFMNPEGCYTRGATALAVNYPNMDIAIGIGHNTKRAPKKAAKECADTIKKKLKKSKKYCRGYISITSGGKVPSVPGMGARKVIKSFLGLDMFLLFFDKVSSILQIGLGRDEDVFEEQGRQLNGFRGIGGTSCDEIKLEKNTQFFMNKAITNSVVSLGICSDQDIEVMTANGLKPSGKKFDITKRMTGGYVIDKINNKPAVQEYLKLMGWSEDVLDERLYRKVFYYPFLQKSSNNLESPRMLGLVYRDKFICAARPLDNKEAEIYTSSGKSMIESVNKLFTEQKHNFMFLISCGTKMETLGNKVYDVKTILDEKTNKNYLLLYSGGEFLKKDDNTMSFMYQSDNAILF